VVTLPAGFADGRSVIKRLFPNARITSGYRGPDHPLSKVKPRSYHAVSRGAVDIAPIPGISFDQYVNSIRQAGYNIVEARDEVRNPSKHATGPHWHVVIGK
jgi:soluble lytic murein transglycosylase